MNKENQKLNIEETGATSIYEGGSLSEIKVEDLKDNEVAIRQLINDYNLKIQKLRGQEEEISNCRAEVEYLKTSPFVSIISAIVNIIGAILVAISINLLTANEEPTDKIPIILLVLGGILILVASFANILYPFAKKWFNK